MKRTKPNYYNKPTKLPRGSRNVGTSRGTLTDNENITENIDTIDSLIVKLTELKDSQNSRIYNENINESIDSLMVDLTELKDSQESLRVGLAEMKERIARLKKTGCGCKGNCSSRICGCVKKSNKCGPSCKCDVDLCHNQKSEGDQENKENKTLKALKKQSRKNDCLFSPD